MLVSQQELLDAHARARREAEALGIRPEHGLFGPGSQFWAINCESVAFFGGGAAALMQLAHPYVAHAIDQHSRTRDDVIGRFQNTFRHILTMVFGTAEQACASASRVYAIHTHIHGRITENIGRFSASHRYHANQPEALFWVHATLVDTCLRVYQALVRQLTDKECDDFYQDSKRCAYLFGIPDRFMPGDFSSFQRYMADMVTSDTIAVGRPARAMARFLLTTPVGWQAPVWHLYRVITAGFLPDALRAPFGLPFHRVQQLQFRYALRALGPAYRALPDSLRYFSEYIQARDGQPLSAPGADKTAVQRLVRVLLSRRGRRAVT